MARTWLSCVAAVLVPVAAYNNGAPRSRLPPLGWSSWVALGKGWDTDNPKAPEFDFCDEVSVKASIDALHEVGLYDAGYRHFHLDDCWADKQRNASGYLQAERDHFPNGMKSIVDYAHSKGLTFGLYTCGGNYTCVGGRPGSRGHFTEDAAVFAEWGVDVVKMDWCHSEGLDIKDTYGVMSRALNATGRPIHFNMCEWGYEAPWTWGPDVAQSWRATGDHIGSWNSTKEVIRKRSAIPAELSGVPYAWNDLDMLESGNYKQAAHANGKVGTMTAEEYKTEFSMWAVLASSMVVTTPILNCSSTDQIKGNFTPTKCKPSITELQKEILFNKEVIAVNQDTTPGGRLVSPPPVRLDNKRVGVQVFARNLTGGDVAVALYNEDDMEEVYTLDFKLLGWAAGTKATARDLWAHKDLGSFEGNIPNVPVSAHQTKVFRLKRSGEKEPVVI